MDPGEVLIQFMNCTGTDIEFAQSFLETNGYDLDFCVNLYLEGGGGGGVQPQQPAHDSAQGISIPAGRVDLPYDEGGVPPSAYFEDEVRAPIMPKQEVLVEEDAYDVYLRRRQAHRAGFHNSTPKGVFEMFRDFNQESKAPKRTNVPETESEKKLKTLADLFRPPVELIEPGSFEDVKNKAFSRKKWLLVNIQTITEFDCQRLNRDTWSDAALKSIVAEGFVLWQVLRESDEGGRYCRFYPINGLPHIAIIDSRTGERLESWDAFMDANALKEELTKFLETHFFDETDAISKVAKIDNSKRKGDEYEEEQLMAAIAASLGGKAPVPAPGKPSQPVPVAAPEPVVATPSITIPTSTTVTTTKPITPTIPTANVAPAAPATPSAQAVDPAIKEQHANPTAEYTCTIQIRLPSGQIKGHFRPSDTLSLVHKYTALHLEPGAIFALCSTFPKRSFTGDALNQTLQQADLVPRAVLICERN